MRWTRRIALSILAVVLTACAGPAGRSTPGGAGEARTGAAKRITAAILGEPYTLSQAINSAGTGSIRGVGEVEKMIHAGLTMLDGQGVRVGQLAEAAPTVENGLWKVFPDGRMETQWTIRSDATWHDGTPVTTEDLLFTFRVAQDKDLALPSPPAFKAIDKVQARDGRQVVVTWKKPFIEADELFSHGLALPLPKHLLEEAYTADKATFLDRPYWTTEFVGAGAFTVHEFVRGSHMEIRAYPNYALGAPKVAAIVVRFIQDPNTLVANVLAGEVDVTLGRGLNLEQALEVGGQWDGTVEATPSNWIAHYPQHLTPSPAVIAQVPFRQALLHALNREEMSNNLQAGRAPVAHSVVQVNAPEYRQIEPQIAKYAYDPRRAAELIEGLGYGKRPDGLFYDPQGQKLALETRTNAGDDLKEKILLATADYWKRIGVEIEVVIVPRQRASDREYRATYPGFDLVRQPFDPMRFHSSEAPLPDNQWKGKNRTRYQNPELNGLIDRYFTAIPLKERFDIVGQMVRVLTEQVVALGTLYGPEPMLIGKRLVNVSAGEASGVDPTWNAHLWDVR